MNKLEEFRWEVEKAWDAWWMRRSYVTRHVHKHERVNARKAAAHALVALSRARIGEAASKYGDNALMLSSALELLTGRKYWNDDWDNLMQAIPANFISTLKAHQLGRRSNRLTKAEKEQLQHDFDAHYSAIINSDRLYTAEVYRNRVAAILVACIIVVVPTTIKLWDYYQRSIAEAALQRAVQTNNQPMNVSASGFTGTMPCKSKDANIGNDVINDADKDIFASSADFRCSTIDESYSTSSLSTDTIERLTHGENGELASYLKTTVLYSLEISKLMPSVSPQPYLLNCVDSTQDINNSSSVPGEAMHVIINFNRKLQTSLGPDIPFAVCEWAGTRGTINIAAETLEDNTIIYFGALTDSSHATGLLDKFMKFLVSVGHE